MSVGPPVPIRRGHHNPLPGLTRTDVMQRFNGREIATGYVLGIQEPIRIPFLPDSFDWVLYENPQHEDGVDPDAAVAAVFVKYE